MPKILQWWPVCSIAAHIFEKQHDPVWLDKDWSLPSKHIENPKPHRAKLLHIRLFIKKQIEPAIAKSIITITKKTNNNRPSTAIIPKKIPKLLDISPNPIISPVLLT